MAGTTIPLFTKRKFDFAGASGTPAVVVIRSLDVSGWIEGVLNVRVHENNIGSASETISVKAYPISNSMEDPSVDYRDETAGNITTVTIGVSGYSAPILVRSSLASDFGSALQITVEGANSPNDATLSAELVLKA